VDGIASDAIPYEAKGLSSLAAADHRDRRGKSEGFGDLRFLLEDDFDLALTTFSSPRKTRVTA
jgi:hypothetical protein